MLDGLNMTMTLLRLISTWLSPTTSATSRAFVLLIARDSNIVPSQRGRNLTVSPVRLRLTRRLRGPITSTNRLYCRWPSTVTGFVKQTVTYGADSLPRKPKIWILLCNRRVP